MAHVKNPQWTRVFGPDLDQGKLDRQELNQKTFKSKLFLDACERASLTPTVKQASKFRRKKGLAFNRETTQS